MSRPVTFRESADCLIPADLSAVAPALERLGAWCRARGLGPVAWQQLELAAAEALNNAVKHGCARLPHGPVTLHATWDDDVITVDITDPGTFRADPTRDAALPDDPLAESGRGGFLMAALVDSVRHRTDPRGHTVSLVKCVGAPDPTPAEDLAALEHTLDTMAGELAQSFETVSALFRFSEELATAPDFTEFLNLALPRLCKLASIDHAHLRLLSRDRSTLDLVWCSQAGDCPHEAGVPADATTTETRALHERSAITVEDTSRLPPGDPLLRAGGAAFVCPVFFRERTLGCLSVARRPGSPYFSAGELGLIRVVADFLGIVRTTSVLQEHRRTQQRVQRELEIATAIQHSLLPETFPHLPNTLVHGVCHAAHEAGGDYLDALTLPAGGLLLVVADVMGKGIPAALLATVFRTALRARLDLAADPAALLSAVNRQITPDLARLDMFITAQIALVPPGAHSVTIAHAGHCPPLHLAHANRTLTPLDGDGLPLGVMDGIPYTARTHPLNPGDRLLFLTDGLYEVPSPGGELLGLDRFSRMFRDLHTTPAGSVCNALLAHVNDYSGGAAASDDRTLLLLERAPLP